MITQDLAVATAMSGKAAKAARREQRRESWIENPDKDLVYIFGVLAAGALCIMLGFMGLLLADPDLDWSVRIPAITLVLGVWLLAAAGLAAACSAAMQTRSRRR